MHSTVRNLSRNNYVLDSKKLTAASRDEMFEQIKGMEYRELGWFVTVLPADYLSNTMLAEFGNGGKNLNKISHDTAIDLINKVIAQGVRVKKVILDTVGQADKYKQIVMTALQDPNIEIVVESKADANHPVVSAASICAKVTRDSVLRDWVYPEAKAIDSDFGCGYPSDPKAKDWL
jgi:ribonuclease H2 subunit A